MLMEIVIVFTCIEAPQTVQWLCLKDREEITKKEYCKIYQQCFYLEGLTKIEWSVSKKQNKERSFEKIEDQEHHFGYCFECDTNQKSRFVRIPFNRLS